MTIALCSCMQSDKTTSDKAAMSVEEVDSITKAYNEQKPLSYHLDRYVDTETEYPDVTGKSVIIQNSLPKGGPYIAPSGKTYGRGVFWTRVINETDTPIKLNINFSGDSLAVFPTPDSFLKLFLPPDTMALDKLWMFDYGITDLYPFLNTCFHEPTSLQKTIHPNEEYIFYIALIIQVPDNGAVRTGFVLKGEELFYKVKVSPFDSTLLPCGQMVFEN